MLREKLRRAFRLGRVGKLALRRQKEKVRENSRPVVMRCMCSSGVEEVGSCVLG